MTPDEFKTLAGRTTLTGEDVRSLIGYASGLEFDLAALRKVSSGLANNVAESNALDRTVDGHYEIEEAEWLAIEDAHDEYLEVARRLYEEGGTS